MQSHRRHHQHLPSAADPGVANSRELVAITPTAGELKRGKKRGSYNCGRCGLPKKGHVCHLGPADEDPVAADAATPVDSSTAAAAILPAKYTLSATRPPAPPPQFSHLRRALSFDDESGGFDAPADGDDGEDSDGDCDDFFGVEADPIAGGLPASCLWDILRRLPPAGLLEAAQVCKGWRETTRRMWKAAEELRLRVPARAQVGLVGSVLHKCPGLLSLSLRIESNFDATMLACIAFSCPNLEFMEISISDSAINRISGDELGRFVADRRSLKSLKMEGCTNLGGFVLNSTSLSTLWLSDLCSLSKTVFNCPNLKEISLEFSRQENDSTDLSAMVDWLGRGCTRLQNIHIASLRLSHAVVLSLTAAQLRGLRMLSLVLGSEISDASVAAIASSYPSLELLDLSGSGISDSGLGIICNVFPDTLMRLLVAFCPNVTSSGIQFTSAQLPLLELMDCGMTICDSNSLNPDSDDGQLKRKSNTSIQMIHQKLIIKHARLKKLSLWGCNVLDALDLNCPKLVDLNLNSCQNLHPERLLLKCPNLEKVHALGCEKMLVSAINSQVNNRMDSGENVLICKRLADGSKRIRIQQFLGPQLFDHDDDDNAKRREVERRKCSVIVS